MTETRDAWAIAADVVTIIALPAAFLAIVSRLRAQTVRFALDQLQESRGERRVVFEAWMREPDATAWFEEEKQAARRVCSSFNVVAFLERQRVLGAFLPGTIVLRHWAPTLARSYYATKPLLDEWRLEERVGQEQESPDTQLFHHFEKAAQSEVKRMKWPDNPVQVHSILKPKHIERKQLPTQANRQRIASTKVRPHAE